MGVIDAPQWLLPAYARSVRALGASAPIEQIRASGQRLVEMWGTPDRRFHTLRHVIDMLARVDELKDESHSPDVMRLATWYHGCVFSAAREQVYRRNGGEDEVASAAYAASDLSDLGVPDVTVDRICALILNLKHHHLSPSDIDAGALNDADLGTLAADPQQYKRYRQLVRDEYAHIPRAHYLRGRLAIISRLLDREVLFSTPLGEGWELPARHNLQAERRRLEAELATIPAHEIEAADRAREQARMEAGRQAAALAEAARASGSGDGCRPVDAEARAAVEGSTGVSGLEHLEAIENLTRARRLSHDGQPHADEGPADRSSTSSCGERSRSRQGREPEARARRERGTRDAAISHTTTMESCAEDLDELLARRPHGDSKGSVDRALLAEAERSRLARCLRERTREAKALREARTGEFAPITEEIVEDGAGEL